MVGRQLEQLLPAPHAAAMSSVVRAPCRTSAAICASVTAKHWQTHMSGHNARLSRRRGPEVSPGSMPTKISPFSSFNGYVLIGSVAGG